MRTVRMESKQSEDIETFIKRAIAVAKAADQPIIAVHSTTSFTVNPTWEAQVRLTYETAVAARESRGETT